MNIYILPETNIYAPEDWWLEDEVAYFQGLCEFQGGSLEHMFS